ATTEDVEAEYGILLNELTQYNSELLDKRRLLAITKCDTADEEQLATIKKALPKNIDTIFISSVSGQNIARLKDALWAALVAEN
ncbi:MAG: GTPase ObgE, partial [Tidjanibacter sp.]|nr:GTPase ObgE [Tidjanibacter sp.]